jgi:hypothetical protein
LNGHQEITHLPLILMADTDLAGDLATAIGADAVIATHPESLTEPQRHAASWEAAAPFADKKRLSSLEFLASRLGRADLVSTDPVELRQAADEGRVEMIAIAESHPDATISGALWATVKNGGEVIWAGDAQPKLTTGVAGLLRY